MVLSNKNAMDTIADTLESGEYDIAIYTRDKHLFIGVKRPHSQMQYYDNDEKENTTYYTLTQEFIDSLDIVCMITHSYKKLPRIVYGNITAIPLLH